MRERFAGLWRDPDFLTYWAASAISDVGSQITVLALPLIAAITLGATAWQMGVLGAAGTAPTLLIGLFAGVWVDRLRRRPVLIAADIGRAAVLLTIPLAGVLGLLRIELLCAVAFVAGALTVLFDVAHLAFLPSLVGHDRLIDGNSKLEVTAAGAQVIGPGLGGMLVGVVGAAFAVVLDALSFLASGWLIGRTRAVEDAPTDVAGRSSVWAEIVEGLRVALAQPVLRALVACSATMALFGRVFNAVYVLYMSRDLGLGATGIGLVLAMGGVGSLAGAFVAGPAGRWWGPGRTLIAAQLCFGLTGLLVPLAVFVPSVAVPMVVAAEFGQWMAVIVYWVHAVSVRQAITADRLRGRVNATIRFVAGGAQPVGALLGGAVGAVIGLPMTLVVAELGCLLAVVWLLFSPVRRLHALPGLAEGAIAPGVR
jgi:MFS family permease